MRLLHRYRKGYFFGYGADQEEDMISAITGHKPKIIGKAVLHDYELRIQELSEITTKGINVREMLRKNWGDSFKSYVIVPKKGAMISGVLFRLSIIDRNLVDEWELVQLGWYERIFVTVELIKTRKKYRAETQILSPKQTAKTVAKPGYRSWLMPKRMFLEIARKYRK